MIYVVGENENLDLAVSRSTTNGILFGDVLECTIQCICQIKVCKNAKFRNGYNQLPHLNQDTIWESDKNTRKHYIQESQEVSHFPAGDHKAAMNRQESITNTKHK